MLNPDDQLEELLVSLGLSGEDLLHFLESLAQDLHVSILTLDDVDETKTRVFNLWEKVCLSTETREFLLSALRAEVIIPSEMEQALAVLFATSAGFADVEEICGILENVVEDPRRLAVLGPFDKEFIH